LDIFDGLPMQELHNVAEPQSFINNL